MMDQLPRVEGGRVYPLSFQQQTVALLEQFSPDAAFGSDYSIYRVLRLRGPLRPERLQAAFDDVVERHSALRTRLAVTPGDDELVQEEFPGVRRPLALSEGELTEDELGSFLDRLGATPIPFHEPPLIRAALHRLRQDDHLLYVGLHHFTCDATGLVLAIDDLARAYEARLAGGRLPPLPIGYGEYALWQAKELQGRFERDLSFWQEYLAGLEPYEVTTDLPFQPGPPSATGAEVRLPLLAPDAFEALQRFATRQRTTPLVALWAGFNAILGSRTTSGDRLAITYFDQRDHPATREMVGYFLRTAPIRTRLGQTLHMAEALPAMARSVIDAYRHAHVPIQHIIGTYPAALPSLLGQSAPWFFVLQYLPHPETPELHFGEARGQVVRSGAHTRQEPGLSLRVRRDQEGGLLLRLGYDPGQWREATMRALADRYSKALKAMMENPSLTPPELLAATGAW